MTEDDDDASECGCDLWMTEGAAVIKTTRRLQ